MRSHSRDLFSYADTRRKWVNAFMCSLLFILSLIAIIPLASVFLYLVEQGWGGINFDFFTQMPAPVGEAGGGMANAWMGTLILVGLAGLVGIPIGVGAGIYLSEYGSGRLAQIIRFATDLLTSVPSILVGLFAYAMLVVPLKHFSSLAGAVALAVILIPFVTRTTEEILKLVPDHIREAGLALGIPRWKVILRVVVRGSLPGITTGVMLAIARIAGETAPLLFTSFGNQYWSTKLDQPISSLPVQIYTYAVSPYEEWHKQAWAGALILVSLVFILNLITRFTLGGKRSSEN